MPDETHVFDDPTETVTPEPTPAAEGTGPKELRDAAQRGRQTVAERDQLKRENAFLRAGIDPEDKRLGYFAAGYKGELTKDAITAAAIEAGFVEAPQPDPIVTATNGAEQRVTAASTGAAPETQGLDAAASQMQEVLNAHGTQGLAAVLAASGVPTTLDS